MIRDLFVAVLVALAVSPLIVCVSTCEVKQEPGGTWVRVWGQP